jgi:hypothetical protein
VLVNHVPSQKAGQLCLSSHGMHTDPPLSCATCDMYHELIPARQLQRSGVSTTREVGWYVA